MERSEVTTVLRGVLDWTNETVPRPGSGYGSGDGYGYGYGYGSGSSDGDGSGYGSGDGSGSSDGDGDGDGYGYGSGDGYGYGYGDGYGSGSGDGSGSGYGYGYGSGSGYGYGSGSGSGDGYGSGSGYASGYGSGSGDGSGYGSGDGSGYYKALCEAAVANWPVESQKRLAEAMINATALAFWKSDAHGQPANGGSGTKATPGLIEEIRGPLVICTKSALHATMNPEKWKGDRLWMVALYGEVQIKDGKFGALKREIIDEIKL